jgi:hypothetical protein
MTFARILALLATLAATPALAQSTTHQHSTGHDPSQAQQTTPLNEPGQGAFAALAEIVALLRASPDTDWKSVNITALRDHLVDMDHLVTDTTVQTTPLPNGLEIRIAIPDRATSAALRMVPAHAPVLATETVWSSTVTDAGDHLIWRVTNPTDAAQIQSLGFFGLMATGDHHRAHHLALALGQPMH